MEPLIRKRIGRAVQALSHNAFRSLFRQINLVCMDDLLRAADGKHDLNDIVVNANVKHMITGAWKVRAALATACRHHSCFLFGLSSLRVFHYTGFGGEILRRRDRVGPVGACVRRVRRWHVAARGGDGRGFARRRRRTACGGGACDRHLWTGTASAPRRVG